MPTTRSNPTVFTIATWCFGLSLIAAVALPAFGNSPELRNIQPVGVQRGGERVVNFRGPRVGDAVELLSHDKGIEAVNFEKVDNNHVRVTLNVDPEARLGEHRLRLRTPRGITNLYLLQLGDLPVVDEEADSNNLFEEAQPIDLNTTVHGRVTDEDVDYYAVEAKEGQRIVAEAQAIRLGRRIFDPHVTILDSDRFILSASDGTSFSGQDGIASAIAPEDGTYIIEIRESAYGGNNDSHYRLNVGDFPRPLVAFPLGGQPGEELEFTLLGDPAGDIKQTVTLPEEPVAQFGVFARQEQGISPTPNFVRISDMPAATIEGEPHDRGNAQEIEHEPPFAVNGIIAEEGTHHWVRFKAKEGQQLDIRSYARQLGSPVDTVLNVFNSDGGHIEGNDDADDALDSHVRFNPPEDGEYFIRVRDHLDRGGAEFAYRVEVTPSQPSLSVSIPDIGRNDTQGRQWVAVPRGNRWTFRVQINRNNVGGDVELFAEDLPEGVTMHAPVIPQGINQAAVVFEADEDAEVGGRIGRLMIRHTERDDLVGSYEKQINLVHRNNLGTFHATPVDDMAFVVTEEAPFKVRIDEPKVPLLQNGPMPLRVVAEREEGFEAPITLQIEYRPPGFNARANVEIPEGETEVTYPVNAGGNARAGEYPISVLGSANVDGGPLYVGSQLATLRIELRRLGGNIQLTAVEQGDTARVAVELQQREEFEGEATLTLTGLPPNTSTEPITITSETEEVIFDVETNEKTPLGQHKSLFVEFSQEAEGEVMQHKFAGGGKLRVDKPREPEPEPEPEPEEEEPEPEPEEPEEEEEEEKPLSRLEQLRKELAEEKE